MSLYMDTFLMTQNDLPLTALLLIIKSIVVRAECMEVQSLGFGIRRKGLGSATLQI
jgi:hypothetical protein